MKAFYAAPRRSQSGLLAEYVRRARIRHWCLASGRNDDAQAQDGDLDRLWDQMSSQTRADALRELKAKDR